MEAPGFPINSITPLARVNWLMATGNNPPIPLSSGVQPFGSYTELIANAEYRAPLTRRLSGAAFFDIGAVFNTGGLKEQQFISPMQTTPPLPNTFLVTVAPRWETLTVGFRITTSRSASNCAS